MMGQEASCTARFGDKISAGRALLETNELIFRGDFRLIIPFQAVRSVEARDGQLVVAFSDGVASFDLGPRAEKWARKILHPRTLMDKLDVKPGSKVAVLGIEDQDFWEQLRERLEVAPQGKPSKDADFIFVSVNSLEELQQLEQLRRLIKTNGAIWVVSPKGKHARIKDVDVIAAARKAGLVDVKVASFSQTHTALKLVVPVSQR